MWDFERRSRFQSRWSAASSERAERMCERSSEWLVPILSSLRIRQSRGMRFLLRSLETSWQSRYVSFQMFVFFWRRFLGNCFGPYNVINMCFVFGQGVCDWMVFQAWGNASVVLLWSWKNCIMWLLALKPYLTVVLWTSLLTLAVYFTLATIWPLFIFYSLNFPLPLLRLSIFIADISIVPLQVHYYSKVLPTTALILCRG